MPPLLTVQGLTKRFEAEGPPVVDTVHFEVNAGEIFALLGPSGCGKTTTLRCIAGFERPGAGSIRLQATTLVDPHTCVPAEGRGIGLVFQDYALFPHQTVLQNVMFGVKRHPRSRRQERALEVLELVGLQGYEARYPHELSGGQQQRVALARTLAPCPPLVLLDEPFSNLDALARAATRQEIRKVLKDQGMTAILVTHDQEEALSFADRVAVMHQGRLEQVGTPEAVYHRPRTLFVAQFLGRTNLLEATATGRTAETVLGPVDLVEPFEGPAMVSLRPEHVTLVAPAPGSSLPAGTVVEREFKGHDITFRVQVEEAEYLVHTHSRLPFQPGDSVALQPTEPAVVLEGTEARRS
ncbi:MAG: ABC transporter ATP-binding protein [Bacteroidota bacterium]